MTNQSARRFLPIAVLTVAMLPAPASSDTDGGQPFVARVDVAITDISVVVRDSDGKPVLGLKEKDFRLRIDGVVHEITNFSERGSDSFVEPEAREESPAGDASTTVEPAAAEVAPTRAPSNRVVFFIDNLHLDPSGRNRLLQKLDPLLDTILAEPSGQAMVVAFSRKLDIIQSFTSDREAISKALEAAKKQTGESILRRKQRNRLRESLNAVVGRGNRGEAMQLAQPYIDTELQDMRRSLTGLGSVVDMLAGVEGRKAVVYVADGIVINPGDEFLSFIGISSPLEDARLETMNYDLTNDFKALTARCNAGDVTLYPVSPQGLTVSGAGADAAQSFDVRYRGPGIGAMKDIVIRETAKLLADDTGGVAVVGTNQLGKGLDTIRTDMLNYYSLGFATPTSGRPSRIDVGLVGVEGDYEVRVRRALRVYSATERVRRSVLSRLFLLANDNPLDAHITFSSPGDIAGGDKDDVLTLVALIPWKSLAMLPNGDVYEGQLEAYLALSDSEDKISSVRSLSQDLTLPAEYFDVAQRESYRYAIELHLAPGPWTISLALRDAISGTTSYFRKYKLVTR